MSKDNWYLTAAGVLARFSLPLVLSGMLQQLYNWADAFIVGHYIGEEALAAIGATGTVTGCVIYAIVGFTTGLSILAAQKYGHGEEEQVSEIQYSFLKILIPAGAVISVLGIVGTDFILRLMNTPENMLVHSVNYLRIILIGIPILMTYNLFAALLRAIGDSKAPFLAVLLSSVINVILDMLFVIRFHWGVSGAAAATILSQAAMTSFIVMYGSRKHKVLNLYLRMKEQGEHPTVLREGMTFAIPLTIQQSINAFGHVVLQNFMNGFGSHSVAAITSAYRVDSIMLLPMMQLGTAISTMVAQSKGAGDTRREKRFSITGLGMSVFAATILMVTMYYLGGHFVRFFGVNEEAAMIGAQFFRNISLYYLPCGIGSSLRGTIEGKGHVAWTSSIGITALLLRIIMSYVLKAPLGNMAVAHAEGIQWVFMLICYILFFIWKGKR